MLLFDGFCIDIRYYSYSYSVLFESSKYSYSYSDKSGTPNSIRIRIRPHFWNRIVFVFVFGPENTIRSPQVEKIQFFKCLEFCRISYDFKDNCSIFYQSCSNLVEIFQLRENLKCCGIFYKSCIALAKMCQLKKSLS